MISDELQEGAVGVQNLFSLSGKRAVVTGASAGLGRSMALALAAAGADLVLVSSRNTDGLRETAEAVSEMGRRAFELQADLGKVENCDKVAIQAREFLGGVDILVNNAGVIARSCRRIFTR